MQSQRRYLPKGYLNVHHDVTLLAPRLFLDSLVKTYTVSTVQSTVGNHNHLKSAWNEREGINKKA